MQILEFLVLFNSYCEGFERPAQFSADMCHIMLLCQSSCQ